MSTRPLSLQEIAGRVSGRIPAHDWIAIVVTPPIPTMSAANEIASEIRALGSRTVRVITEVHGPRSLVRDVNEFRESILLFTGFSDFRPEHWQNVDLSRSLLSPVGTAAIVVDSDDVQTIARHAPHFFSWFGSDVWELANDAELLSPAEIAIRLDVLRRKHSRTDQEVLDEVTAAKGDVDPELAEWVALLGRADVI